MFSPTSRADSFRETDLVKVWTGFRVRGDVRFVAWPLRERTGSFREQVPVPPRRSQCSTLFKKADVS